MNNINLELRPRHLAGSDVAKKVRRAGLLPAVVYGKGVESRAVAVDAKKMTTSLQGPYGLNQIFECTVRGEKSSFMAIANNVSVHPVTRRLLHVDFRIVDAKTKLKVNVPFRMNGVSAGQMTGCLLRVMRRQAVISCTPDKLPEGIDIDLTPFEAGEGLSIDQVKFPSGVSPMYKKVYKIFEISRPKIEIEETDEETDEEAEEGAEAAESEDATAKESDAS